MSKGVPTAQQFRLDRGGAVHLDHGVYILDLNYKSLKNLFSLMSEHFIGLEVWAVKNGEDSYGVLAPGLTDEGMARFCSKNNLPYNTG